LVQFGLKAKIQFEMPLSMLTLSVFVGKLLLLKQQSGCTNISLHCQLPLGIGDRFTWQVSWCWKKSQWLLRKERTLTQLDSIQKSLHSINVSVEGENVDH
jgi:hypothetical protein